VRCRESNATNKDVAGESIDQGEIALSGSLNCVIPDSYKACFAASASAEPPKFPWSGCGNLKLTGVTVVATHLKLTTLITVECSWKDLFGCSTTNASLLFSIKARRNALAQQSWTASDQPAWLTQELFEQTIQPLLANVSMSVIRSYIGVSKWYASKIRQGYRPHPRHWRALAELVALRSKWAKPQLGER
jgi:hypothetical protein